MGRHKADSWLAGLPGCPQSVSRRCVIAAICVQKFYELFVLHLLQPLCHPQTSSSTSVAFFFCILVKERRWEVFAVADCQLKLENAMETAAFNSQRAVRRGAPNETERHSHSKTMMSAAVRRDQKDQERHSREHPARADQAGHEQTWPESTSTCRLPHGK
ncbi:GD11596 [Drosophila simulans]|uniref:GD11596 n=1 Tax=Drosophila simulans TaxID=7240 RepID=B4QG35_DROSI|nr:GD11596 [Drosophila simulans]